MRQPAGFSTDEMFQTRREHGTEDRSHRVPNSELTGLVLGTKMKCFVLSCFVLRGGLAEVEGKKAPLSGKMIN